MCTRHSIEKYFRTYTTVKVVDIEDRRIKWTYLFLIFTILVFCSYNVLYNHQFCEIIPLHENHYDDQKWWDIEDWAEAYKSSEKSLGSDVPYCNGSLDTDYWYDNTWKYLNNSCMWDCKSSDITSKTDTGLRATTSFGMWEWENETQTHALLIPHIEDLSFSYSVNVNFRNIKETPEVFVENENGDFELQDAKNDLLKVNIQSLLDRENLNLDMNNTHSFGDQDEVNKKLMHGGMYPIYRLTGLRLKVIVEISNIQFSERFLDYTVRSRISFQVEKNDDKLLWTCTGWRMIQYKGEILNVYSCDLIVRFDVSGSFCFFSYQALLYNVVETAVLFSLATFAVDRFFNKILHSFKIAKRTNDAREFATQEKAQRRINQYGKEKLLDMAVNVAFLPIRTNAGVSLRPVSLLQRAHTSNISETEYGSIFPNEDDKHNATGHGIDITRNATPEPVGMDVLNQRRLILPTESVSVLNEHGFIIDEEYFTKDLSDRTIGAYDVASHSFFDTPLPAESQFLTLADFQTNSEKRMCDEDMFIPKASNPKKKDVRFEPIVILAGTSSRRKKTLERERLASQIECSRLISIPEGGKRLPEHNSESVSSDD